MQELSNAPAYQDVTTMRDAQSKVNFVLSDPWSPPAQDVYMAHAQVVAWINDPRLAAFKDQLTPIERQLCFCAAYRAADEAMRQYTAAYGLKLPPMMREILSKAAQAQSEQQRAALYADGVKAALAGMQAPVVNVNVPEVPVTLTMPDHTETITVKRDSDGLIKSLIKRVPGAASA